MQKDGFIMICLKFEAGFIEFLHSYGSKAHTYEFLEKKMKKCFEFLKEIFNIMVHYSP